nr:hypothetical protein [Tanacetum cinerariifolium]
MLTSNAHHQSLADAGSETRHMMLEREDSYDDLFDYLQQFEKLELQQIFNATTVVKGHYARNYPKPRVRNLKYFMEQIFLATQDEAEVILTDEQNAFLFADVSRVEEIEKLNGSGRTKVMQKILSFKTNLVLLQRDTSKKKALILTNLLLWLLILKPFRLSRPCLLVKESTIRSQTSSMSMTMQDVKTTAKAHQEAYNS